MRKKTHRQIAELAKQAPSLCFTTLAHHIDLQWLHEAFLRTRWDGATGVDGQTAEDYAVNRMDNLQGLLDRAKSGTYQAPPVRRVHIPKGTGNETRPIGIPTFEDKVLQWAVVMVLEPLYCFASVGRSAGVGGLAQAVRQVRADAPSRQDAVGGVPTAQPAAGFGRWATSARDL